MPAKCSTRTSISRSNRILQLLDNHHMQNAKATVTPIEVNNKLRKAQEGYQADDNQLHEYQTLIGGLMWPEMQMAVKNGHGELRLRGMKYAKGISKRRPNTTRTSAPRMASKRKSRRVRRKPTSHSLSRPMHWTGTPHLPPSGRGAVVGPSTTTTAVLTLSALPTIGECRGPSFAS